MTPPQRGAERARSALRRTIVALLVLTPLPFASVQPWAVLVLELGACAAGVLALAIVWREPDALPPPARLAAGLAAALVGIGLIQLVPVPAGWTRLVAGPTAAARAGLALLLPEAVPAREPASLVPPATLDALLRLAAYVLLGCAAAVAVREARHRRQIAAWVAACGAFQGLYGAAEYLSGHQHIFGYAKRYYLDCATGTFINRNHFAGYLALALPLALGLVLDSARRARPAAGWRDRVLGLAERRGTETLAAGAAVGLIWIGIALSYSRGGLVAALVAAAWIGMRAARRRRALALVLLLLALPTCWLLWRDVRAPGDRFVAASAGLPSVGGRLPVWAATVRMVPDYLPFGSGLGTFHAGIDLYRPPDVHERWDHAHNDWLQLLAEGGPAALALGLALLLVALRAARAAAPEGGPLVVGAAAALAAAAVHAGVDFGGRIPAIATLIAVLVGLLCAAAPSCTSVIGAYVSPRASAGVARRNQALSAEASRRSDVGSGRPQARSRGARPAPAVRRRTAAAVAEPALAADPGGGRPADRVPGGDPGLHDLRGLGSRA